MAILALPRELIRQLPAVTVLFCLVDGLAFFESERWGGAGLGPAVEGLRDMVSDTRSAGGRNGAIVKVLLTSAGASRYAKDLVPAVNRLAVPRGALGASGRQMHGNSILHTLTPPRYPVAPDASTQEFYESDSLFVDEWR